MRTSLRLAALTAAAVLAAATVQSSAAADSGDDVHDGDRGLFFRSSLAGSLPTDPVLFGVAPGGAPWVIDEGSVRLDDRGRLRVEVEGLVIPGAGNPVPELAASLVCNGAVVATTATVPYDAAGDARIRAEVDVPDRCIAPVVLLNPAGITTVYIGVSGDEA